MSKRKYTPIKPIEPELFAIRKAGYTRQEIVDHFGLEKNQIKGWAPKHRGRPGKDAAPKDIVLEQ